MNFKKLSGIGILCSFMLLAGATSVFATNEKIIEKGERLEEGQQVHAERRPEGEQQADAKGLLEETLQVDAEKMEAAESERVSDTEIADIQTENGGEARTVTVHLNLDESLEGADVSAVDENGNEYYIVEVKDLSMLNGSESSIEVNGKGYILKEADPTKTEVGKTQLHTDLVGKTR